jgi:hypothetical protein
MSAAMSKKNKKMKITQEKWPLWQSGYMLGWVKYGSIRQGCEFEPCSKLESSNLISIRH